MNVTLILILTAAIAMGANGELKPIPSSGGDHVIQGLTASGSSLLATREMLVNIVYPSGKTAEGDMLVLFDPASSFFYWQYHVMTRNEIQEPRIARDLATNSQIYVAADRLAVFSGGTQVMFVRDSLERASSLDDAQTKAFREAEAELGSMETSPPRRHFKEVPLPLPLDFFAPKYSAAPAKSRLIGVLRQDGKWTIIVEGQWKVRITLDDKYEVISTERVP